MDVSYAGNCEINISVGMFTAGVRDIQVDFALFCGRCHAGILVQRQPPLSTAALDLSATMVRRNHFMFSGFSDDVIVFAKDPAELQTKAVQLEKVSHTISLEMNISST
ncbi:unnamed protein product [Soboliphyme baturini]|uniref:Reverse transcriptase domain-containing protein n=1 Tax=Soboliphyme baturini TaxID=241478 RepID=A0A183I8Y0_9BILA|nr:unnamed protein product [Soboliphyme baturini]